MSSCGFLPVNLPATRLVSLIRKDFSLQVSKTESVRHPAQESPDFHHLLAIESEPHVQAGQKPLHGELWHITALSVLSRSMMARGESASALPVLEAQALILPSNQKAQPLPLRVSPETGSAGGGSRLQIGTILRKHGLHVRSIEAIRTNIGKKRLLLLLRDQQNIPKVQKALVHGQARSKFKALRQLINPKNILIPMSL